MNKLLFILSFLVFQTATLFAQGTGVVDCPYCMGSGSTRILGDLEDCKKCSGSGRYVYNKPYIKPRSPHDHTVDVICPTCQGCKMVAGYNSAEMCYRCNGRGYLEEKNDNYNPIQPGSKANKLTFDFYNRGESINAICATLSYHERNAFIDALSRMYTVGGLDGLKMLHGLTAEEIIYTVHSLYY